MRLSPFSCMVHFDSHTTDENGYTHSLVVNGENILSKWGVEFSDGHSFFIQGQKTNSTHKILRVVRTKNKNTVVILVQLSTAPIQVDIHESFTRTRITRKCTFTPLKDVKLTDIAISQAFHQEKFSSLEINGNKIPFLGVERNHQFETSRATLAGKSFDLAIHFKSKFGSTGFVPVIYGRTSPHKGWVIHSRLFPHKIVQKAIVWCNKWWNKRIPFSDTLFQN